MTRFLTLVVAAVLATLVAATGPADAQSPRFYYAVEGQQEGPVGVDALAELVAAGTIDEATLVWRSGMAAWTPAGDVGDLAALFQPPPLPPTLETAAQEPETADAKQEPEATEPAPSGPFALTEPAEEGQGPFALAAPETVAPAAPAAPADSQGESQAEGAETGPFALSEPNGQPEVPQDGAQGPFALPDQPAQTTQPAQPTQPGQPTSPAVADAQVLIGTWYAQFYIQDEPVEVLSSYYADGRFESLQVFSRRQSQNTRLQGTYRAEPAGADRLRVTVTVQGQVVSSTLEVINRDMVRDLDYNVIARRVGS